MGVKGSCRSANRGGPSFMPFMHIAKGLPSCLPSFILCPESSAFILSGCQISVHLGKHPASSSLSPAYHQGKTGQKWINFWGCLVFSRDFGRPKTAKSKHIFEIWCWCVVSCAPLAVVFHRVHWPRGVQAFEDSGPVIGRLWSSGAVFPAFCPLSIEEINIRRQQYLNKLNQFKKTRINLKKILHNKDFWLPLSILNPRHYEKVRNL